MKLNRDAMNLPASELVGTLTERVAQRRLLQEEQDRAAGGKRVRIFSYMENIGWPPLFGYDMNRFYQEPEFMLETELRQRLFWLDNSEGDDLPGLWLCPTTGFYWDITLFGQRIRTAPDGVPEFLPHPLADKPDLALLPAWDFNTSGDMPILHRQYRELRRLSQERYGGAVTVGFPVFHRGPLDVAIQMRGYENFIMDIQERPEFVHALLAHIVRERVRWNRERAAWLGETFPPATTFIADDWINPPFISPTIFREFAVPAFQAIQQAEGPVTGFHTCGPLTPLINDLLTALPGIDVLDVSGWNDLAALDAVVAPGKTFHCQMKNTFVLSGTVAEHRALLKVIKDISARRPVSICAQAIVKLHDTYEDDLARMNAFIRLAREQLA